MGFESGTVSFRMFTVPRGLPEDFLDRFARDAAPPVDTLGKEPIHGWVSGRHLLDRIITGDNAIVAGRLRLTLMKAERKVPEALLRAECMMEELAVMQAEGVASLKRPVRSQIRKEVTERLLPQMPPTLTGIPLVYENDEHLVLATASSDKQIDALTIAFERATERRLIPLTPAAVAAHRRKADVRDLPPTSFSPELEDELAAAPFGYDFLTWLWFFSEARGGIVTSGSSTLAAMVEGPLTFFMEGRGAHMTVLKKGEPLLATETKTALMSGKKLREGRLTLTRDDETWSCTLGAEEFRFRSLKLPKGQAFDPVGKFEERMLSLGRFRETLMVFFDRFLDERLDPARWADTRAQIHAWVTGREGRA